MAQGPIKLTIPLTRFTLYVTSFLVLGVASSLFFFPGKTDIYFSWTIKPPLTAVFLGAGYLAGAVLEFFSAREKVWANGRTAVPGVWVFSVLTLIVTLIHIDRFHFAAPQLITVVGTWVWLLVYISVPILMGAAWILQARLPGIDPPRDHPLSAWLRVVLVGQLFLMVLTGLYMLLATEAAIPNWPWLVSPLTCRAIGVWGVSIGVIAGQAVWENDWRRLRTMMMSYLVFGMLQLVNLLRFTAELRWTQAGSWLYTLFMLSIFLVGLYGVWQIRRLNVRQSA